MQSLPLIVQNYSKYSESNLNQEVGQETVMDVYNGQFG